MLTVPPHAGQMNRTPGGSDHGGDLSSISRPETRKIPLHDRRRARPDSARHLSFRASIGCGLKWSWRLRTWLGRTVAFCGRSRIRGNGKTSRRGRLCDPSPMP